jgi:hypothetical protein
VQGFSAQQLLTDLHGVAAALDSLTARRQNSQLVHAAVKPANLLRFGTEVRLGGYDEMRYLRSRQGDAPGAPVNCVYAAPELREGWPSSRSDVYGLAMTYGVLRTGRLPSAEPGAVAWAPPDLSGLPDSERQVLALALSSQVQRRPATCARLLTMLRKATTFAGRPPELQDDEDYRERGVLDQQRREYWAEEWRLPKGATRFEAFVSRGMDRQPYAQAPSGIIKLECPRPRPLSAKHRKKTVSKKLKSKRTDTSND